MLEELDLDAVLRRRPASALSTSSRTLTSPAAGMRSGTRMLLEILDAGIHVHDRGQHPASRDAERCGRRVTGVRVRETVPDTFLDRADEVINVDVTVEELHNRLKQARSTGPRKSNRRSRTSSQGNLSDPSRAGASRGRRRSRRESRELPRPEGLEPALIPERVMVCMSSQRDAPRVLRTGARIAGRLGARWYAVYVETPRESARAHPPAEPRALQQNISARREPRRHRRSGEGRRPADGLIAFATREGITHVVFGQTARSRMEIRAEGFDPEPVS